MLDLSRVLAGPYCTWILASLGADVVKVEQPGRGDQSRDIPPFVEGESVYYMSLNREKRGMTLDLKHAGDVMRGLLPWADVLVENFSLGVMERLGLGYEAVSAVNPRLVYTSISGFGQTGPARNRRAYDQVIQALSGVMSITGEPGRPPVRVGFSIGDIAAGMFASTAILAALRERDRSGVGQHLDVSMLDSVLALLENPIARYLATGETPERLGSRHPTVTPNQGFEAADGWFVVSVGNDEQWPRFCRAIGHPELLEDERFARNADRTSRQSELEAILQPILRQRMRAEWIECIEAAEVPAAPINSIAEVAAWEHLSARKMLVEVEHPVAGPGRFVRFPVQMSGAGQAASHPAPTLGQDTDAILRELGFVDGEIASLRQSGVV